jgi:uncharacterized protein
LREIESGSAGESGDPVVLDDPDNDRYVIEVEGDRVGLTEYHLRNSHYFFVHTETDPAYSGRGLATRLIRSALDDVRSQEGSVVPICPFVASFIKRHPEYDDLVDHEIMERVRASRRAQD